jgi:hypothetical protein
MHLRTTMLKSFLFGPRESSALRTRRPKTFALSCESLEDRVTPAHFSVAHHAIAAHVHAHHSTATVTAANTSTTPTTSTTSTTSSTTAVAAAEATLKADVQTIELKSGTTVGQLTAIEVGFQTLKTDGLSPTSQSALTSFENSLVTANASGTTLAGNATLLSQFEALYTSAPTTQQTTDLTATYNALAAAVSSSNITSSDITTINTDYSALLTAEGSTSTATYPYFNLVTGHHHGFGGGCG